MLIFLLGMPASGKTTLGKKLAQQLDYAWVDLDDVIEEVEARCITSLFQEKGETYFREQEQKALHSVLSCKNTVVSTGGGTPCFFNNMQVIKRQGLSIFLNPPLQAIAKRIQTEENKRPMFQNFSEMELNLQLTKLYKERITYYTQATWIF